MKVGWLVGVGLSLSDGAQTGIFRNSAVFCVVPSVSQDLQLIKERPFDHFYQDHDESCSNRL